MSATDAALLVAAVPTARQLTWQAREFSAFIHFGMNTVTGREWGTGTERAEDFTLGGLDPDQWMPVLVRAGARGVILTAKHHDGFCLWPTATTTHSVAHAPWRGGRGDVVAEVADAAARHGLDFGVYLSPWDRADERWGTGAAYDDLFVAQLEELLTGYGDISSVWFDGANGDPDRRQDYDWARYEEVIRRLQPGAAICVCGPDVRWCGNEAGHPRANEWSVVPRMLQDAERIAERSQHADDGAFSRLVRSDEEDLGSRDAIRGFEHDLVWYPAEVNTSVRPGWFYHPDEDTAVRTPAELFDIYLGSVGGNGALLLNVAPTPDGLLAEPDVRALEGLGELVSDLRARTVLPALRFSSGALHAAPEGAVWPGAAPSPEPRLTLENGTGWWEPDGADEAPTIACDLGEERTVSAVVLKEEITASQRLEHVVVRAAAGDVVAEAFSVGYQRIIRFPPVRTSALSIEILASRGVPKVAGVGVVTD